MVLHYFIYLRDSRHQVKPECTYWLFAVMFDQACIGPWWTCVSWSSGSSGEDLEDTIKMQLVLNNECYGTWYLSKWQIKNISIFTYFSLFIFIYLSFTEKRFTVKCHHCQGTISLGAEGPSPWAQVHTYPQGVKGKLPLCSSPWWVRDLRDPSHLGTSAHLCPRELRDQCPCTVSLKG